MENSGNPPFDLIAHIEQKRGTWTIKELSPILGVSQSVLYAMAKKATIPSIHIGGGIKFNPKQTADWLRRRTINTYDEPKYKR